MLGFLLDAFTLLYFCMLHTIAKCLSFMQHLYVTHQMCVLTVYTNIIHDLSLGSIVQYFLFSRSLQCLKFINFFRILSF